MPATNMLTARLFICFSLAAIASNASPNFVFDDSRHQELESRDNKYKLKCSNAPTVVAGVEVLSVQDVDLQTTLPPSGSSEPWYHYLWCTPGTKTYTFFNFGQGPPAAAIAKDFPNRVSHTASSTTTQQSSITKAIVPTSSSKGILAEIPSSHSTAPKETSTTVPPPLAIRQASTAATHYNVSGTLANAVVALGTYLSNNADGPINGGDYTAAYPDYNVQIYVQNHPHQKVTVGILRASLTGLYQAVMTYNQQQTPILFQINDGKWGEVGIGYVGLLTDGTPGSCQYSLVAGQDYPCSQIANGTVVGGLE